MDAKAPQGGKQNGIGSSGSGSSSGNHEDVGRIVCSDKDPDERAASTGLEREKCGFTTARLGDGWQRPKQAGPNSPFGGITGSPD